MSDVEDQYRDSVKLSARAALHRKYGGAGGLAILPADATPTAGAAVLEVGCGGGRFWRDVAGAWPADLHITLTDLSPGMVAEAMATVRALDRWRNVTGQVADVAALPFADGAFDTVIAMHMLYHAPDPAAAVAEIARVLRPGGMAVVSTNGANNLAALFELGDAAFGIRHLSPDSSFTLDIGERMLAARFARVEMRRSADVLRVSDPADLVAYLTSFPPGDRADPATLERLRSMAERAVAEGDGAFDVARDTGYLLAWKS